MTDCPRGDIRDVLPDLIHGTLEATVRAEVERHVATCAECAAEVALLRSMQAALSRGPRVDTARIAAAVRDARRIGAPSAGAPRPAARRHGLRSQWRIAAGIAAVAVGVMSYAIASDRLGVPNARPSRPTATQAATEADRGISFDGGVSDLSDSEVQALLQTLDDIQAVPDVEPAAVLAPIGGGGWDDAGGML